LINWLTNVLRKYYIAQKGHGMTIDELLNIDEAKDAESIALKAKTKALKSQSKALKVRKAQLRVSKAQQALQKAQQS